VQGQGGEGRIANEPVNNSHEDIHQERLSSSVRAANAEKQHVANVNQEQQNRL